MVQGDAEIVSRGPRAVGLDEGVEPLVRGDGSVEQKVVLAVNATAAAEKTSGGRAP